MKRRIIQRIGILTGGGDCPGLNAVIRAATKTAILKYHLEVFGIEDGYEGLIVKRGRLLQYDDVSNILTLGGTILGTSNRADPFHVPVVRGRKVIFEDHSQQAVRHFREWGLDALLAIGGDGTLSIARGLSQLGIPVVGIPKTIDNDLSGTDFTFGFDTAVQIATEAVDRLHTTAASHHRVMILEVMGRNAGWIALYAGAAGGADIILIPEMPFSWDVVFKKVIDRANKGKKFSIIVVAEGAHAAGEKVLVHKKDKFNPFPIKLGGIAERIVKEIEFRTKIEARSAVLGHIQRGGSPSPFDRNLGTLFGSHAVELAAAGKWGRMVCLKGQDVLDIPLNDAVSHLKVIPFDHPLVRASKAVGASFGVE